MKAIGYARTSTDDQVNGMEAQVEMLRQVCERHGWGSDIRQEHASGKSLAQRPEFARILGELAPGDRLVVTTLSRLSRSVIDFASLLDRAESEGWAVVVCDMGGVELDTSTATGRLCARMVIEISQWEREVIGERTKAGLARVKASGIQLGHPSTVPADVRARVVDMLNQGMTVRAAARMLNDEGVPGPSGAGSKWHGASVGRIGGRYVKK